MCTETTAQVFTLTQCCVDLRSDRPHRAYQAYICEQGGRLAVASHLYGSVEHGLIVDSPEQMLEGRATNPGGAHHLLAWCRLTGYERRQQHNDRYVTDRSYTQEGTTMGHILIQAKKTWSPASRSPSSGGVRVTTFSELLTQLVRGNGTIRVCVACTKLRQISGAAFLSW